MNRIAHLTGDDYLTLLENLERAGAVKFAEPPQRLVRLGDIGGSQLPFTPDYSHNVAGVGTLRGCETPEEERTVLPISFKAVRHPINGYRLYRRTLLAKLLKKIGGRP